MKTIEERALEYAERICSAIETNEIKDVSQDFANGARSEHEMLTRWNDPEDVLPDMNKNVLVKFVARSDVNTYYYTIGMLYENNQLICENDLANHRYFKIIGWRKIFE